jgi:23S rRNA (cytosine1962-C5)-methyltransferase
MLNPGTRRVAVRITPDARRRVRAGHPWVFDSSVTSAPDDAAPGDLAVVFDDRRRFMAIGLYDPASPIRIKVLHHGRPVAIDPAWWAARLDGALARRAQLFASRETTAFRCINGENDGFPGLTLDRYDSTLVMKVYSAAWLPHLGTLVAILEDRLRPQALVLRSSRAVQRDGATGAADGIALLGVVPAAPVRFLENGLVFEADVVEGHKTGHFLDQRENRARVRDLAAGARVLDVFSYTGGFSVHAAAGGARTVHSVDVSAQALDACTRNFAHNRADDAVRACRHTVTAGDAFEVMQRLAQAGERFDLVIVDPPSFAQRQTDVDAAVRAYRRLTQLAVRLVAAGGVLVQSSCSSRVPAERFFDEVEAAARMAGAGLAEIARTGHAEDHPVGFPEGAYLKTLFATVDR